MATTRKINTIWVQNEENFKKTHPEYYSYISLWKQLFPNYEYKLWSEEEYIKLIENYSAKLLKIYKKAPSYACKSDIARLIILYYIGGLYVDVDYEPFKRFDYLFNDENLNLVLVAMNLNNSKLFFGGYRYSNAWIYAKKECVYIKAMLDRIIENPYDNKKYSKFNYTMSITGPTGLTTVVEKLKLFEKDDVRILSHSVIEVADFSNTAITTKTKKEILKKYPFVVGVHRMQASWVYGASTLKKLGEIYTFYNNYSDFVGILSLIVIITLIISLYIKS